MPDRKYVFAIDLGTGGPKVALVSDTGEIVAHEFEETALMLLPGGGAEQDPDDWWWAITTAAQRMMSKNPVNLNDIVAVSATAQWSGTVAVDKQGQHLMNSLIWMDSRGEPYIHEMIKGLIEIEGYGIKKLPHWLRLTGGMPTRSGKDPIAHILFIKETLPEIYAKTYKFLEPKDYLNLKLTGKFAASFDSITMHWLTDNRDIHNIKYADKLFKYSGLDKEKFPDLKPATHILGALEGKAAEEFGLKPGIPVGMGTPDLQSAALGSGATKDFEGHLYIGTSSWIICHIPFKKTDIFHNMASLPSPIPGRYFLANEQETAGAALTYLKNNIFFHSDELKTEEKVDNVYQAFDRIVEKTPAGSEGIIFTPWLYGERTPVEEHTLRGGFHNLSLNTTREHYIRAVFEGVAYNSRWLLKYVEKFIKKPFPYINMIGGGANSDIWCQIHADVLNREIRQVKDPILSNIRGVAFLAFAGLGLTSFDKISDSIIIKNTYQPNPDHLALYDTLFKEYLEIYKANRKIYKRLNSM